MLSAMKKRKPNQVCQLCGKPTYKRPIELELYNSIFCSRKCMNKQRKNDRAKRICCFCGLEYLVVKQTQKYCSRSCAGKMTRNRTGTRAGVRKYKSKSAERLGLLRQICNFDSCMIEGCNYNRTYDVHRLIMGKDGGEYIIGNMFAICPNHHTEIHGHIIEVEKVNDYTLRIVKDNLEASQLSVCWTSLEN